MIAYIYSWAGGLYKAFCRAILNFSPVHYLVHYYLANQTSFVPVASKGFENLIFDPFSTGLAGFEGRLVVAGLTVSPSLKFVISKALDVEVEVAP